MHGRLHLLGQHLHVRDGRHVHVRRIWGWRHRGWPRRSGQRDLQLRDEEHLHDVVRYGVYDDMRRTVQLHGHMQLELHVDVCRNE